MKKELNEDNKIESLKEGSEHFGKVTQTEKEFNLNDWISIHNEIHMDKIKEFIKKRFRFL